MDRNKKLISGFLSAQKHPFITTAFRADLRSVIVRMEGEEKEIFFSETIYMKALESAHKEIFDSIRRSCVSTEEMKNPIFSKNKEFLKRLDAKVRSFGFFLTRFNLEVVGLCHRVELVNYDFAHIPRKNFNGVEYEFIGYTTFSGEGIRELDESKKENPDFISIKIEVDLIDEEEFFKEKNSDMVQKISKIYF